MWVHWEVLGFFSASVHTVRAPPLCKRGSVKVSSAGHCSSVSFIIQEFYESQYRFWYGISPEKAMAPHSSTLAWKIPWMEESGRLQSMGSLRVRHDWTTSLSLSCIGEGNGNPLQCSCLENPRDGGAWWAAVSGVAQSRTRLKWLSSSNMILTGWLVFVLGPEKDCLCKISSLS